jgi:hypothetical protein
MNLVARATLQNSDPPRAAASPVGNHETFIRLQGHQIEVGQPGVLLVGVIQNSGTRVRVRLRSGVFRSGFESACRQGWIFRNFDGMFSGRVTERLVNGLSGFFAGRFQGRSSMGLTDFLRSSLLPLP